MWKKRRPREVNGQEKGKFPLIVEVCPGALNAFPFLLIPACANADEFDSRPASAETRPINFHRFAWPTTANIYTGLPVQFSIVPQGKWEMWFEVQENILGKFMTMKTKNIHKKTLSQYNHE